jgi:UTP--glucose-1-phosphate uridylyltransferase
VTAAETHKYGIVSLGAAEGEKVWRLEGMVEKPPQGSAPSRQAILGRYILQPGILSVLDRQEKGAGGEIQLTDAMTTLMAEQPFFGFAYEGRSFDCGSKIGFLAANVALALARSDLGPALRKEIARLL